MKKLIFIVCTLMACCGVARADASELRLGLCRGELATAATLKYNVPKKWVHAAAYIPAETMRTFAGNRITAIRAGLVTRPNIEELTVWVRSSLQGENLAEKTITKSSSPAIMKGWNNVALDVPFEIPADSEGLYIGYSFYQAKSVAALAAIDPIDDAGLFCRYGDEEWIDRSAEGTLCVEAVVKGETLPQVNLSLVDMKLPETYISDRGVLSVNAAAWNRAAKTVTGFDATLSISGMNSVTRHYDLTVAHNEVAAFNIEIEPDEAIFDVDKADVELVIENITQGADLNPADNTLRASCDVARHEFKHRILVEEFTTEKCVNCPRVAGYIHDALQKDEFKDNVIVVCHHSGYVRDAFTTPFDLEYEWFFGESGYKYAPAMMIDRKTFGEKLSTQKIHSQEWMEDRFRETIAEAAPASVEIVASVSGTDENHLSVRVSGSKIKRDICDNPHLTVYLIEDNIPAYSQEGATDDYIHMHVGRQVNETWGAPIEFDGYDYDYTCEFTLSPSIS